MQLLIYRYFLDDTFGKIKYIKKYQKQTKQEERKKKNKYHCKITCLAKSTDPFLHLESKYT